jgi:large subunit ribosomal protein L18
LVIRPSNKHLNAQLIRAEAAGDKVIASAHSSELKGFGWKAACGNMPSAYLVGLLIGKRAKAKGVERAILDIGLARPGSRIFAAAKGALDGGLVMPIDKEALPAEGRIRGDHVASYSKSFANEPEVYKRKFSGYLRNKLKPEDLQENFATVQAKINSAEA